MNLPLPQYIDHVGSRFKKVFKMKLYQKHSNQSLQSPPDPSNRAFRTPALLEIAISAVIRPTLVTLGVDKSRVSIWNP